MKKQAKIRRTRCAALMLALLLLVLALFVGTTLARQNEGTDDGAVFYKARLVDEYDDTSAQNWNDPNEALDRRIAVLNPGSDGDQTDSRVYGAIYARIQLKEFMELSERKAVYSADRYMVDQNGKFLSFDSLSSAQAYLADNGLGEHRIDQMQPFGQTSACWYIQTRQNDPNGIYGNYLILNYEISQVKNLIQINPPAKADMDEQKTQELKDSMWQDEPYASGHSRTAACDYTIRRWHQGLGSWDVNGPGQPAFTDYVSWIYGSDVILMSDWDGTPCDKWIADDSAGNTEGWVYWGGPIAPGQQTGDFITALRQKNLLSGLAYYAIHVDMETVSYDELDNWNEANDPGQSGNDSIVNALKTSRP